MTTKELIDLFKGATEDHANVNYFDYGTVDFLFSSQTDIEYPLVFLQLTGGQIVEGTREERTFTLYSLQSTPDADSYVKNDAFDYNTEYADARDTALQTLRDITKKVKLENLQDLILSEGNIVFDNDQFSGAIGWRQDLTIVTVLNYDIDDDFPESE